MNAAEIVPFDPRDQAGREPHNVEAELGLLGCAMRDNEVLDTCGDLRPEHFYDPVNARIWAAILDRRSRRQLADAATLVERFAADPGVQEQGGFGFFADLIDHAPPSTAAESYAAELVDLAMKRGLIRLAEETARRARLEPQIAAAEQVAAAERGLVEIAHSGGKPQAWRQASVIAKDALVRAKEAKGMVGLSTGLHDLDQLTGGLRRGQMTIIAGRPGMGKSSAALHLAKAARHGRGIAFYSLEMPEDDIGLRMAADLAHDPLATRYNGRSSNPTYHDAARGLLNDEQWWAMEQAAEQVRTWPLEVDARAGLTISEIRASARRKVRDWERAGVEPGLILVDHLTIVRPETNRSGNKVAEVGDISRGLAEIAKELDIALVALCQLSRDIEKRGPDKRPNMADLRWSGEIEQDARVVMFLYRPEYYVRRPEDPEDDQAWTEWRAKLDKVRNKLFWLVEKTNNGPTGEVETYCDIGCSAIRDRLGGTSFL